MAWEGEKTLTFTIEDALISMDSFRALTGATYSETGNKYTFKIFPTSFAAYYSITARTLFRDDEGSDHAATITIPKAKLQTTLNLSMAPNGDPSSFTFTFDAFPDATNTDSNLLFKLEVDTAVQSGQSAITTLMLTSTTGTTATTNTYEIDGSAPTLTLTTTGTITFTATGGTETASVTETVGSGKILTNLIDTLRVST